MPLKLKLFTFFPLFFFFCIMPAGASEIHDAVEKGNLKEVKKLLTKNPELLNIKNENKLTPVNLASFKGHKAIVAYLVAQRADLAIGDNEKSKPLHVAAVGGHKDVVEFLLGQGVDINEQDTNGMTPLHFAASWGREDVFQLLIDKGADVQIKGNDGRSVFDHAVLSGKVKNVKILLDKGFSVNMKSEQGGNPFHQVIMRGQKELIDLFLSRGTDINAQTKNGETALHFAIFSDKTEVPAMLLKKGAKIDQTNNFGETPLYNAVKYGKKVAASYLLNQGAQVNIAEKRSGKTALHVAAIKGYHELTDLMLKNKADVNTLDANNKTPLHYAAKYGYKKTAQILMKQGAQAKNLQKNYGPPPSLNKKLNKGEAVVYYLGHSGWAIKTQNYVLVFDYYEREQPSAEAGLANGYFLPAEFKGNKIIVFVTHSHQDHYFPKILTWRKSIPDITYVFGFKPEKVSDYIYMGPRQKKKIKDLEVATLESNDTGVGFLVKVDGLTLFHAGDHANRKRDFSGPYTKEIDWIAQEAKPLDLAFLPISGCGFGDQVAVKKGAYYAINKLNPKVTFPMHAGQWCIYRYTEFSTEAEKENFKTKIIAVENQGDMYIYKPGKTL